MRAIIAVLLVALVAIVGTYLVFEQAKVVQRVVVPFNLTVSQGKSVGIAVDTTIPLRFGSAMPGSRRERFISVGNEGSFPVSVSLRARGPIADWVDASRVYHLGPDETARVSVIIEIPDDARPGDYQGEVVVTTFR